MDENDRLQDSVARYVAPADRHCGSDIYDCEACGLPLDYAINEEGEAANHDGELVCTDCALAYMVDEATGDLRRAPALLEMQDAEIARLNADLTVARRLLPPRYIAANGSIMDPERCTPHAAGCAECGRGRAHDEACLGLAETPAEESVGLRDAIESVTSAVERLTAERAELLELVGDCDLSQILAQQPRCYCGIERDQHVGERHTFEAYTRPEEEMAREIVRLRAERAGMTAERDAIAQALDDDCAPDIDGQQVMTLADRVSALLGHWQDEIRGALCAVVPDPHRIDGGGCDSGDPLDLTLAEVAQAVNQLTDQADEQIAALTAERDAARRDAEERRLELLAERGDAEGAPSADWTPRDGYWEHTSGAEVLIAPDQSYGRWQLWLPHGITGRLERASDDVLTARAAMRRLNP